MSTAYEKSGLVATTELAQSHVFQQAGQGISTLFNQPIQQYRELDSRLQKLRPAASLLDIAAQDGLFHGSGNSFLPMIGTDQSADDAGIRIGIATPGECLEDSIEIRALVLQMAEGMNETVLDESRRGERFSSSPRWLWIVDCCAPLHSTYLYEFLRKVGSGRRLARYGWCDRCRRAGTGTSEGTAGQLSR